MRASVMLGVCLLASLPVAGCGTASTSDYSWRYTGSDEALQSSPTDRALALRRKLARERGERPVVLPTTAEYATMQEDYEVWRRQLLATIDEARAACARKTGDSGKWHFWTGYDPAFSACMDERGWVRATAANPL